MMNTYRTLALCAMLGLGTLALAADASAAPLQPFSPLAASGANALNTGIVQVKHRNSQWNNQSGSVMMWDQKRHGNRCKFRNDDCNHFYRGHYYQTPWWTLPVIIGGGLAAQDYYGDNGYDNSYGDDAYYDGGGSSHVEWCLNRYRSYNPRTNTWVSYSGQVRQCTGPY